MAPCPPSAPAPGHAGAHRDAPGRGGPEPGGCACRWGHYFLFVFLFLCRRNKQGSGFLQSHCSSQTQRISQPLLLLNCHRAEVAVRGARRIPSAATSRWSSSAFPADCADFCAVFPVEATNLREFLLSQFGTVPSVTQRAAARGATGNPRTHV